MLKELLGKASLGKVELACISRRSKTAVHASNVEFAMISLMKKVRFRQVTSQKSLLFSSRPPSMAFV